MTMNSHDYTTEDVEYLRHARIALRTRCEPAYRGG